MTKKFMITVALAFISTLGYAGPSGEMSPAGSRTERSSVVRNLRTFMLDLGRGGSYVPLTGFVGTSRVSVASLDARVDEVSSGKVSFLRQTMEALSLGQSYIPLGGFGLSATAERTSVFPPVGTKTKSDEVSFFKALSLGARYIPQGGWGWSSTREDGRIVPEAKPATSSLSSRIAAKASNALRQLKEMAQSAGRGTMYSGLGGTLEPARVIAVRDPSIP